MIPYLFFIFLFLTISLTSEREKNATLDECAHLPAGYTYVASGDFRLNTEHPPLIKVLSAIPLLFLKPKIDFEDQTWKEGKQWDFGIKFLYEWNDADRLLFWGRVPVILLSLIFGFCVCACARDFYGEKAGYVALALYFFNPDLLAHGQLVTTDLAAAGFLFVAVYTFYRALRRMTTWNILLACVAAGLALTSKFSGLFLFPMLVFVGGAFAYSPTPVAVSLAGKSAPQELLSRRGKFAAAAALIAATALVGVFMIWGAYKFRYTASEERATSAKINFEDSRTIEWEKARKKLGRITYLVQAAHDWQLVPEAYLYGFYHVLDQSRSRPNFLLGRYSDSGWRYYFLATFLVKTPIPLILLIVLGGVLIPRYGAGMAAEAMLLLPAGLYWAVALTSHINIGHRHLLPIYPFLIVFASKVARTFDSPRPRLLAVACALLIGWNVLETASIYPHFLAYFNQIAGGPSGGYRWLVDSNLDWGQDLKGLAKYRREHPDEPFYLSYFGNTRPQYYGIKAQFLPGFSLEEQKSDVGFDQVPSGAIVAVSVTNLQCVITKDDDVPGVEQFMSRLRSLQPIAEIGYSIKVYRLP